MKSFVLVIIAVAMALLAQNFVISRKDFQNIVPKTETAYERVMRTGTLRCGYITTPPNIIKDSNTGNITGIVHDTVEAMAASLTLKVQWVEEVGFATMFEGLAANRYDAVCSTVVQNPSRARVADFVQPFYYLPFNIYMTQQAAANPPDLAAMNDTAFKFAALDGGVSDLFARADFPKATILSNPDLSSLSDLMMQVATKKADVVIMDAYTAAVFARNNPNSPMQVIRYRVYPASMLVAKGEYDLKQTLDVALQTLLLTGQEQKIIGAYEKSPDIFLPAIKPYQTIVTP